MFVKKKAYAECWWRPRYNSYRLFIKNRKSKRNLYLVKYDVLKRRDVPAGEGCNVNTFIYESLSSGERIILPPNEDLTVLCFRLDWNGTNMKLITTDKLGNGGGEYKEYGIDDLTDGLYFEYTLKIRSLLAFRHEIIRRYYIPHIFEAADKSINIFHYLHSMQSHPSDRKVKAIFKTEEEVMVFPDL
jgi:hypothetical protein